jgi:CDP-diacylglycerol--glycerol-3-phosphate 3-phosphatidyltransferase
MFLTISNILTVIRIVLVPVFLVLFFSASPILQFFSTLIFIAGAITDHYDGKLARKRQEMTEFGRFADPLADKFLTLSSFIAILVRENFREFFIFVLIYIIIIAFRELGITFLRMWAISQKSAIITSFWGKLKTTFQLIAIIFALVYFNARDLLPIIGVNIFFINDLYFIPIIHFLILISMVITVISGLLYLTPSSYESRAK